MRAHADAAALENTIIINTCAVTAEAQRQARQAIRRARRERPQARIVVTGCAAQIDPASFAAMDEVDLVLGNEDKLKAAPWRRVGADFGAGAHEKVVVNEIMSVRETASHMVDGFAERTRAFVQIQNGCDHRCTFCIIPFGRGNSRSVPAGEVVAQVRNLVARGYREIVLTGVDITAYGADLPGKPSLGGLVRRVLRLVPELQRLRLSSLDSVEADEDLMRAIAEEERLMPHFHLSLQSGDDLILKRMKRRHLRGHSIAFCEAVRRLRPDAVFGADIIAGFPTETDEMFANSCRLVEECGLTFLHVFPYSPRPGTPAARMPQVPGGTIKRRAAALRALGEQRLAGFLLGEVGARRQVLAETETTGRTQHYAPVRLAEPVTPGSVVEVDVIQATSGSLVGRVLA
ncbi:tRNA (N(6)-L-threonylcarbamoyladenosine(37)-C(2))-methylthiotransferase MtaB [Rhodoligotrophos defluvii]|uniref:tRNA (N(6)-L-threonylcarbamoyladenosine(37)-C(2))- methylthiotransferase MtaB n=1 Tax=Rhodoligotrophos defluvii TaxID=2561934 RepID=UPI003D162891